MVSIVKCSREISEDTVGKGSVSLSSNKDVIDDLQKEVFNQYCLCNIEEKLKHKEINLRM